VLSSCPDDSSLYYDDVAQVELAGWSQGPVTLVGDACGAVSLMAGQGSSMAMGGAWVLADELNRGRGDVPAALRRYEDRARPSVTRKQAYGRSASRWLVPESRWRMAARGVLLRTGGLPGGHHLLRSSLAVALESVVER
jgi:2-polyprenyl-6-methoxyphenol hydroxylase-like FAD-dependent oxidoreductase